MKTILLLLFLSIFTINFGFAQSVTISPNGTSAIIDANSTNKGFLPPRMTMTQRSNLTATEGLMVFCTDCAPAGHYGYSGSTWKPMFDYLTSSGPCVQYTVGQQAQGGTVFWVDDSGQHGLVAAPEDLPFAPGETGLPWAPYLGLSYNYFTICPGSGIYSGQYNTTRIFEKFGWGVYASFLCKQMAYGNYGDWYLPGLGELQLIYNNRNLIQGLSTTSGNYYWSSTEESPPNAYFINFFTGTTGSIAKYESGGGLRARAIRRF